MSIKEKKVSMRNNLVLKATLHLDVAELPNYAVGSRSDEIHELSEK